MPDPSQDFYMCPGCGDDVRVGSSGCPRCSSATKKQRKPPRPEDLGDDFDYEAFVREEFGNPLKPPNLPWFWWITALLLLAALAWNLFGRH